MSWNEFSFWKLWGVISPYHRGLRQRQPVTNDVASRPMVGEATEYDSASEYVAPFDGRKSTPRLPEKSGGRFNFNAGEYEYYAIHY